MPTASRAPAKSREPLGQTDLEGRVRTILAEAATELNSELATVEFHAVAEHPKRTAEFTIIHVSDGHAAGFLRAFAFAPVMQQTAKPGITALGGFTVSLQMHLDEHDEVLSLREESLLETAKEKSKFKDKVKDFLQSCIRQWLK